MWHSYKHFFDYFQIMSRMVELEGLLSIWRGSRLVEQTARMSLFLLSNDWVQSKQKQKKEAFSYLTTTTTTTTTSIFLQNVLYGAATGVVSSGAFLPLDWLRHRRIAQYPFLPDTGLLYAGRAILFGVLFGTFNTTVPHPEKESFPYLWFVSHCCYMLGHVCSYPLLKFRLISQHHPPNNNNNNNNINNNNNNNNGTKWSMKGWSLGLLRGGGFSFGLALYYWLKANAFNTAPSVADELQ